MATRILRDIIIGQKVKTDISYTEKEIDRPRDRNNSAPNIKLGELFEIVLLHKGVEVDRIQYTPEETIPVGSVIHPIVTTDFVQMVDPKAAEEPK